MSESKKKRGHRRGNGEGSITRLPNGGYKQTITVGIGVDGKQKRRSVQAKTKTELAEKVARLRIECGLQSATDKDMLFSDLVNTFMAVKRPELATETQNRYQSANRKLFSKLYPFKVSKITADMINEILIQLKDEGLKNSTINSYKKSLNTIFNFAIDRDVIPKSPVRGTITMKEERRTVMVLPNKEQIEELLKRAKERDSKIRVTASPIYPAFLLAVATGLREGELLGLTKEDIKGNKIQVNKQLRPDGTITELKTSTSYRTITVSRAVIDEVLKYSPDSNRVFSIKLKAFKTAARTFLTKNADILPEGFHFHDIRHYHATTLLAHGVGIQNVSRRLGHADIATTLRYYSHYLPQQDEFAAELFDDIL